MMTNFFSLHWKKEWTGFAVIVVVLRVFYAAIGIWFVARGGPIPLDEIMYRVMKPFLLTDQFSKWLVNPWFQWDTVSYLEIAIFGYSRDPSVAFMPLYPLFVRWVAPVFGENYLLAALVVSTLSCFISLVLMYELFVSLYPQQIAGQSVVLFMAFPTAFFLLAAYTESLFLMLVLGFWILALKKHWLWAAVLAGLATLARLQGAILSLVMLWMMLVDLVEKPALDPLVRVRQVGELFTRYREKLLRLDNKTVWLASLTPILAAMGYQAWLYLSGYGTITDALRKYWKLETVAPWTGLILFLQRLISFHFVYMDWIDLALFIIILIASLIGLRFLDPAFSLYVWSTMAVLFTRGTPPHLLASYSRYFLALFPLFILPALSRNKHLMLAALIISFSLQILLVCIFLWGSWVA